MVLCLEYLSHHKLVVWCSLRDRWIIVAEAWCWVCRHSSHCLQRQRQAEGEDEEVRRQSLLVAAIFLVSCGQLGIWTPPEMEMCEAPELEC